jgi:hypothetical protein
MRRTPDARCRHRTFGPNWPPRKVEAGAVAHVGKRLSRPIKDLPDDWNVPRVRRGSFFGFLPNSTCLNSRACNLRPGLGLDTGRCPKSLSQRVPRIKKIALEFHTLDEKEKRHGQAVAAASLPELEN